jgi:hypothetical protein
LRNDEVDGIRVLIAFSRTRYFIELWRGKWVRDVERIVEIDVSIYAFREVVEDV